MKTLGLIATIALIAAAAPAFAQTKAPAATTPGGTARSIADCETNFKAADKNNDGTLDRAEIAAAKATMPTSISGLAIVAKADFLSACNRTVPSKN